MAVAKVTVTAKTGPAKANTALVINDVKSLVLDFERQVIQVYKSKLSGPSQEFDMTDTVTVTDTVAGVGLGHTIVLSSS